MSTKAGLADLGRHVYGLVAVALGVLGWVTRDFAAVWQPIENLIGGADRKPIAIGYAAALLGAGVAAMWRTTARAALVVLAGLHLLSMLGWIPRIVAYPLAVGTWNGFFELFSLVVAGVIAYSALSRAPWTTRTVRIARRLFAICLISFGASHLLALDETARMVPKWIPLGQQVWAAATGVFYLLAAGAILLKIQAWLAARLVSVMMLGFAVLAWGPLLLRNPVHFTWAGTIITVALASAAWIVADSLSPRAGESGEPAEDSPWTQDGSDLTNPASRIDDAAALDAD